VEINASDNSAKGAKKAKLQALARPVYEKSVDLVITLQINSL